MNLLVKEIVVSPGNAAIRQTIPMPEDSRIPGLHTEEMALRGPVQSTVSRGGAEGIRTPDPLHAKQVLSQLSYSPKVVWDINYMHGVGEWIGGEGGDGWKTMSQWGRQCVE